MPQQWLKHPYHAKYERHTGPVLGDEIAIDGDRGQISHGVDCSNSALPCKSCCPTAEPSTVQTLKETSKTLLFGFVDDGATNTQRSESPIPTKSMYTYMISELMKLMMFREESRKLQMQRIKDLSLHSMAILYRAFK